MPFEKIIPVERQDGNKYLLRISEFQSGFDFGIPVVDVQFVMVERDIAKPALGELIFIAKELLKFLNENDVVLYYYCDNVDMQRSNHHSHQTPQEYRYLLFDRLYEWFKNESLVKDDVIIREDGGHYISLISTLKNKSVLTDISNEIEKLNDK